MAEAGVSSPILSLLMRVLPQPLRGDTNDFIRACVVLISPLVFTLGMYASMFDQPSLHSSLLHVVLNNLLPLVMIVTKSYRIPGAVFVAMQYFFSYQMMESLGPEYGYTTPAFFLPLVRCHYGLRTPRRGLRFRAAVVAGVVLARLRGDRFHERRVAGRDGWAHRCDACTDERSWVG